MLPCWLSGSIVLLPYVKAEVPGMARSDWVCDSDAVAMIFFCKLKVLLASLTTCDFMTGAALAVCG